MEESTDLEKVSETITNRATAKTIYGEPIETHGKTIIPVARVAYGFGGGHGKGQHRRRPEQGDGEGEGAGGGMVVIPRGVMEVTDEETRFIPIAPAKKVIAAALLGAFFGFVIGGRRAKRKAFAKMQKTH